MSLIHTRTKLCSLYTYIRLLPSIYHISVYDKPQNTSRACKQTRRERQNLPLLRSTQAQPRVRKPNRRLDQAVSPPSYNPDSDPDNPGRRHRSSDHNSLFLCFDLVGVCDLTSRIKILEEKCTPWHFENQTTFINILLTFFFEKVVLALTKWPRGQGYT